MQASSNGQSVPSLPKNTIRKLELKHDDVAGKEERSKLARFGPIYGEDTDANQKAKDSAWKHILQQSGSGEDLMSCYKSSFQLDAMDIYDATIADTQKQSPERFRLMMVTDGCFFLQLALHILGARKLLGYPQQHPYFGINSDSGSWIRAMFYPGNQIPCVVINALMKQTFFQNVIKKGIERGTWQKPTKDLAKLVLYQTVVEPQLNPSSKLVIFRGKAPEPRQPPSDILQALHSLLLGSGHKDAIHSDVKGFWDLETGSEDSTVKFPSAGELYKLGVKLKKAERGITNIRFQNRGYSAYLYLPPFIIDAHTKDFLTSLANHELSLSVSDRELTAYFRFMRDLAHTNKDFKILVRKGIIQVNDEKAMADVARMLDDLVKIHKSNFTLNFRQIRRKITDYGGPPWRLISIVLFVLTVVQTIFTVLSYCTPRP